MPSWGGKNRPLPDTGKRVNMPGQQQDFAAPYKDGRPRRKAAQEGKAAKDTEDPLVKLELVVELFGHGLLSVREYELLKQHILTDLLSTALGWPSTAQDQGRGRATLGKAQRPALLLGDVLEEEGSRLRRCTHHLAGGRDKEAQNRTAPAARGPRRHGSQGLHVYHRVNPCVCESEVADYHNTFALAGRG